MIDLLVSIAVLMLLIAIMLPALARATETAHRVVCSSNVRQIGIGLLMYADTNQDELVPTTFNSPDKGRLEQMLLLRLGDGGRDGPPLDPSVEGWDGLGILFYDEYLSDGKVFFCPSHTGAHPFSAYACCFGGPQTRVVGNYQYRGAGKNGQRYLSKIEPRRTALIADGMRTQADYNHKVGGNVMRADLSVTWFRDYSGKLFDQLPAAESQAASGPVAAAWDLIDGQLGDQSN
ncbi:MAG: hypothetical protein AAFX79_02695 [Planctomycetota bacterium]